jgi:hypothetical protein
MNQPKELEWRRLFANALPERKKTVKAKCTCGNGNCRTAKKIRCTCSCHSLHHGEANRVGMEPLDRALGLEKEAPIPLGDLGLSRELSGLAEVEGEI